MKNLQSVFQICRKYSLKLNPYKCHFFKTEVTYLGHKCTNKGILPDDSKYTVVQNYPTPNDKDEVKRFIAFANYYRRFIPHFAELAKPLNHLTKLRTIFTWTQDCHNSFQNLKNCILNPIILQYPDFAKEFILTVDASKIAAGAVLSQNFDGNDLPIAFASKTFTKGEINKSTIEKELTAIYFGIKHFRPYLYGTHFVIKSDHKPLSYLFALTDPSSKLTRMRIDLEEYNFTVQYIKGKDNVVADALSRISIDELKLLKQADVNSIKVVTRSKTKSYANDEIIHNIDEDKQIKINCIENDKYWKIPKIKFTVTNNEILKLKVYKKRKQLINIDASSSLYKDDSKLILGSAADWTGNEKMNLDSFLSKLDKKATSLSLAKIQISSNDDIFRIITIDQFKSACNKNLEDLIVYITTIPKKVLDENEKNDLLKKYHDDPIFGGHAGKTKIYAKLRPNYYWNNMSKDISKYVNSCKKCMLNKPKYKNKEPMQITDTPYNSFETIVIDTIGPFRLTANGNRYAVTMVCDLTKYLITVAIPDKEAKTIAKAIFENCILIYGPMNSILSDRGTEYVNEITKELFALFNVQHKVSTAYHHETLGAIERNHRVLNEYLRAYNNENLDNWDEFLKYFTYCYNVTPHTSLNNKYSPFELIFAKNPPIQEFIRSSNIEPIYNFDNYSKQIKFKLQHMQKIANEFLNMSKNKNKLLYDRKITSNTFKENETILLRNENRNKLEPVYSGPYKIIEILEPNVKIKHLKTEKEQLVHKNRIVKWNK